MFDTLFQLIVWIIVGAIAGSAAAMVFTRSRTGYGRWINVGLGMVGALLGGFLRLSPVKQTLMSKALRSTFLELLTGSARRRGQSDVAEI